MTARNPAIHDDSGKYTPEYRAYMNAKTRCENPNDTKRWNLYGGRGIKFKFKSIEEFLNHVGPKPTPQHMLDRIDSNGHYEIGNVRWATVHEQMLNRRMTPRRMEAICKNLVIARKNHMRDPVTNRFISKKSHQRKLLPPMAPSTRPPER
jgi:hypothetical protein